MKAQVYFLAFFFKCSIQCLLFRWFAGSLGIVQHDLISAKNSGILREMCHNCFQPNALKIWRTQENLSDKRMENLWCFASCVSATYEHTSLCFEWKWEKWTFLNLCLNMPLTSFSITSCLLLAVQWNLIGPTDEKINPLKFIFCKVILKYIF